MRKWLKQDLTLCYLVWIVRILLYASSTERIDDKSSISNCKVRSYWPIRTAAELKPSNYVSYTVKSGLFRFEVHTSSDLTPIEWYAAEGPEEPMLDAFHSLVFGCIFYVAGTIFDIKFDDKSTCSADSFWIDSCVARESQTAAIGLFITDAIGLRELCNILLGFADILIKVFGTILHVIFYCIFQLFNCFLFRVENL